MKKTLSKLLSLLLAVLLILSSLPMTVFAADEEEKLYEYTLLYTEPNGTKHIEITDYNGSEENIVIPSEFKGAIVDSVRAIFNNFKNIKSITISEGIKTIEKLWFWESKDVDIYLPSSVVSIGSEAMRHNEINNLYFSEGLESIGHYAFLSTEFKNTNIKLPESLKYLNKSAFNNTNITKIHLGSNVRFADYDYNFGNPIIVEYDKEKSDFSVFYECVSLAYITVSPDNKYLTAVDDVLYNKDMTVLYRFPSKHNSDFEKNNPVYDYEIPESVKYLAPYSFGDAKIFINKLTFNSTIETIPKRAFREAYINEIDWGDNCNIKVIESEAFYGLTTTSSSFEISLKLPKSIERICIDAFAWSDITTIDFETPSNCKVIEQGAFHRCYKVKSIFIPNSVESLGIEGQSDYGTFEDCCYNRSIVFEDGSKAKVWPYDLFDSTSATKLIVGKNSSLEEINCSLKGTSISSLDFSGCPNLRYIAGAAFNSSYRLSSVDLSNTKVNVIESRTFSRSPKLETVILPDSCFKISSSAFSQCTSLQSINTENVAVIKSNSFSGCPVADSISRELKTTEDRFSYYETDDYAVITGCKLSGNVTIPETINGKPVTVIDDGVFSDSYIYNVNIPDTVKYIGDNAFKKCKLESLELPDSLEYIGESAFTHNSIAGKITMPENVKYIGANAFSWNEITQITLNDGLEVICDEAFYSNKIDSLFIPNSVYSYGKDLVRFAYEITFGSGCKNIENYFKVKNNFVDMGIINVDKNNPDYSSENGILYNKDKSVLILCTQSNPLKELHIPNTVNEICEDAFTENKYLESVYIPNSLKIMGDYAFQNCSSLNYLEFEDGFSIDRLYYTFEDCLNLKTAIFPSDSKVDLFYGTFRNTGLTHCELPDYVDKIVYIFRNATNLKNVELPKYLNYMGDNNFSCSGIESIVIPDNIKKIQQGNFHDCGSLKYIDLNNVTSLSIMSFANCTSLESIDLTNITYYVNNPKTGSFAGCDNLNKFYFNKDTEGTNILEESYNGNETLETIVVGNSIKQIQSRAFADCTNLTTALISDSVTQIADTAFENCNNLNIVCKAGSYAESYAEEKSIPYTTFVVAPIPDQEYTGKEIEPALDVTAQSKELSLGNDYTAVYTDNINVGTAKVNVIGLGDYSIFASLVKFNIVGGENQNIDTQLPDSSLPNDEDNQNNNDSVANGNSGDDNSTDIYGSKSPNSHAADKNTNDASANNKTSPNAEQNSIVDSSDNSNSKTTDNKDRDAVNENNSKNDTAQNTNDAKNSNGQNNPNNEIETEQENSQKWYEVVISAIMSFFNKIVEFFKAIFS